MTFQYEKEVVCEDEYHDGKWVTYEYEATGRELGDALVEVITDLYFGAVIKSGVSCDTVRACVETMIYEVDYETLAEEFEERLSDYFQEEAWRNFRERMNLI